MKTADKMLRDVCSAVMDDLFPYEDRGVDKKEVDDQLYELSKLSLEIQKVVLNVRENGTGAQALRHALYEVVR